MCSRLCSRETKTAKQFSTPGDSTTVVSLQQTQMLFIILGCYGAALRSDITDANRFTFSLPQLVCCVFFQDKVSWCQIYFHRSSRSKQLVFSLHPRSTSRAASHLSSFFSYSLRYENPVSVTFCPGLSWFTGRLEHTD